MYTCYIIGAGDFEGLLKTPDASDLVIAADAGYIALSRYDIRPDVILGDFDSAPKPDSDALVFPVEKDDTDTMLALKEGMRRGYSRFFIYGGMGGRLDHTLANIQSLAYLANRGGSGVLLSNTTALCVIKDRGMDVMEELTLTGFDVENIFALSVFAVCGTAEGVTLKNVKYTLDGASLYPDFPLGVSNHPQGRPYVEVKKGMLAVSAVI